MEREQETLALLTKFPFFNRTYFSIQRKNRKTILITRTKEEVLELDDISQKLLTLSDGKQSCQTICKSLCSVSDNHSNSDLKLLCQRYIDFFNRGIVVLFEDTSVEIGYRNVLLGKKILLGKKAHLGYNNVIYGPCYIKDTRIQSFTQLGPNIEISNSLISNFCDISYDVTIKGAYLNSHVHIKDHVEIGEGALLASHVQIEGKQHYNLYPTLYVGREAYQLRKTKVGNFTWIGSGAKILDVKIGDWSIIGAGAVVNKDVPAYHIGIGDPVKIKPLTYKLDQMSRKYEVGRIIGQNQFAWRQKMRGFERDKDKTDTFFGKRTVRVNDCAGSVKMTFEDCPVHQEKINKDLCLFHKGLIDGTFSLSEGSLRVAINGNICVFDFTLPRDWTP